MATAAPSLPPFPELHSSSSRREGGSEGGAVFFHAGRSKVTLFPLPFRSEERVHSHPTSDPDKTPACRDSIPSRFPGRWEFIPLPPSPRSPGAAAAGKGTHRWLFHTPWLTGGIWDRDSGLGLGSRARGGPRDAGEERRSWSPWGRLGEGLGSWKSLDFSLGQGYSPRIQKIGIAGEIPGKAGAGHGRATGSLQVCRIHVLWIP